MATELEALRQRRLTRYADEVDDYLALALDRVCKQIGLGSVYNDDSHQWASVIASYVIAMAILSAGDA